MTKNEAKLIKALKDCVTLFNEIEPHILTHGLARGIIEYRYNALSAIKKVKANQIKTKPKRKRLKDLEFFKASNYLRF